MKYAQGMKTGLMAAASVAALFASAAQAQDTVADPVAEVEDASGGTGEIVVTAQRKEQLLSRVPQSIAAFAQETMDQQNVRGVEDIARLTPGITFSPSGRGNGGQTNISIRGIRSETGTPTTGIYIDDTPIQVRALSRSGVNAYPRIFDLERVEVLRGPQGTLFGAGSQGGTIRFITPTPSLTESAIYGRSEASVVQGGDLSFELGLAAGVPLIEDKLAVRVSAWARKDGGWIDRVDYNTNRLDETNANSGSAMASRVSVLWEPIENLRFVPQFYLQRTTGNDAGFISLNRSNLDEGGYVNAAFIAAPSEDEFWTPSLRAELDLGAVSVISNTSYFHRDAHNVHDSTLLNYFQFTGQTSPTLPASLQTAYVRSDLFDTQRTFVQEVRLQSNGSSWLNWVVGAFYSHQRQTNQYLDGSEFVPAIVRANPTYVARFGPNVTVEQAFNGVSLVGGRYSLDSRSNILDKQIAGFGQIDAKITPELTATVGLRYSDVTYEADNFSAGPVMASNGTRTAFETGDQPWTPKFGLAWQVTPDHMVYGSAAKGFRPGSFVGPGNSRCLADLTALGLGLSPREIRPDTVWSYEAGFKSRALGRRLAIDASAYHIDWNDIQSQINLPSCGTTATANMGKARSRGFDIAMQFQATPSLLLNASVGYTNAKYTETTFGAVNPVTGVPGVARSEGEPLGAAPWTVAASARYEFNAGGLDSYARADFQYASHDSTPLDTVAAAVDLTLPRMPETTNLDLRLGTEIDDFDISFFVANALNQNPILTRYRDTTRSVIYRGVTVRPRTFGITATFRR